MGINHHRFRFADDFVVLDSNIDQLHSITSFFYFLTSK